MKKNKITKQLSAFLKKKPDSPIIFTFVFISAFLITLFILKLFVPLPQYDALAQHFSPEIIEGNFSDILLSAIYDETMCFLYIFLFGFTFFGRAATILLTLLRALSFGYSFYNIISVDMSVFTPLTLTEAHTFFIAYTTVNAILLFFSAKSHDFNILFRQKRRSPYLFLKGNETFTYIKDFLSSLGITVLIKIIYTTIIFVI